METAPRPKAGHQGNDEKVSMTLERDVGLHTETFVKCQVVFLAEEPSTLL